MHKFLRAVGFSEYKRKSQIERLLDQAERSVMETRIVQMEDGVTRAQIYTEAGRQIGLSVCGEYNEADQLEREYYFPFLRSVCISTTAPCQIQRHAEKESYAGICEEYKVGVSLIFYLQNSAEYLRRLSDPVKSTRITSVMLSGLSTYGRILLPVYKTEKQRERIKVASLARADLLEAARRGDAKAMDSLAIEDMDIYNSVTGRVRNEDIYSIVDSSFMPFGVECDQYSVLGEIQEIEKVTNGWTNEEIYVLMVECSDLVFQIGINADDLLGEPAVGRRFKGTVWLQGYVNFAD